LAGFFLLGSLITPCFASSNKWAVCLSTLLASPTRRFCSQNETPQILGFLKANGQRGGDFVLYLLKRNKAIFFMTAEEKEELETRKLLAQFTGFELNRCNLCHCQILKEI